MNLRCLHAALRGERKDFLFAGVLGIELCHNLAFSQNQNAIGHGENFFDIARKQNHCVRGLLREVADQVVDFLTSTYIDANCRFVKN